MNRWIIALLVTAGFALLISPYFGGCSAPRQNRRSPIQREFGLLGSFRALCFQFADDHGGAFPASGEELARYLQQPGSHHAELLERSPSLGLDVLRERGYFYRPGLTVMSPPDTVLAYLPPGRHPCGFIVLTSGQLIQVSADSSHRVHDPSFEQGFETLTGWEPWEPRLVGAVPAFESP